MGGSILFYIICLDCAVDVPASDWIMG